MEKQFRFFTQIRVILFFLISTSLFAQKAHIVKEVNSKRVFMESERLADYLTENMQKYDAIYYSLDLNIDPDLEIISGNTKATIMITDGPLTTVDLHLSANMGVDSVLVDNVKVGIARMQDILTVDLNGSFENNETKSISVYYNGSPSVTGLGSFQFGEYRDRPLVTSLSFAYGARNWWPCKDVSFDKADSMDIKFTVPEGMIAASNGHLVDSSTENGLSTFSWKVSYPISTYLVSLAAHEYTHYTDWYHSVSGDSMAIEFFVAPEHFENSQDNFYLTNDMIEVFADLFGEYPFMKDKYGHAEFPWGGGMEHQTITSLGPINSSGGFYSFNLIAHELAHQWWGDMITCKGYEHIWINEGFATYSEALIREVMEGEDGYWDEMHSIKYWGPLSIFVEDVSSVGRILYVGTTYNKGAWVLHMLRHVVGDITFFKILPAFGNDPELKYSNASTEDFQRVCEEVSGMDLGWFFKQWIYGEYFPVYSFSSKYKKHEGKYNIELLIEQVQDNTGLFKMPIDIVVETSSAYETFVVWDSLQSQTFHFTLDEEPVSIELDPKEWILRETHEKILNPAPKVYKLHKNYSNLFNTNTTITYSIPFDSNVNLSLYNSHGQKVNNLVDKTQAPGNYEVSINASNLLSGVYFYRIEARSIDGNSNFVDTKKLMLFR